MREDQRQPIPGLFAWLDAAISALRPTACAQRLVDVPEDVLDILDAHRQPDHVGPHAGARQFRLVQLAVRGGGRMDHQRLGVADVGQVAEELAGVDEALAGLHRVGRRMPKVRMPEAPGWPSMARNCFFASAWCGESARPG